MTEQNIPQEKKMPVVFPGQEPQGGRIGRDPYQEQYIFFLALQNLQFPLSLFKVKHEGAPWLQVAAPPAMIPKVIELYREFSGTQISHMLHRIEEVDIAPFRSRITGMPLPLSYSRRDATPVKEIPIRFAMRAFVTTWNRFLNVLEEGGTTYGIYSHINVSEDIDQKIHRMIIEQGVNPYYYRGASRYERRGPEEPAQ